MASLKLHESVVKLGRGNQDHQFKSVERERQAAVSPTPPRSRSDGVPSGSRKVLVRYLVTPSLGI